MGKHKSARDPKHIKERVYYVYTSSSTSSSDSSDTETDTRKWHKIIKCKWGRKIVYPDSKKKEGKNPKKQINPNSMLNTFTKQFF